ncbi:hypothetical protein TSOC_007428, partial [Tetrabaena socialis]
ALAPRRRRCWRRGRWRARLWWWRGAAAPVPALPTARQQVHPKLAPHAARSSPAGCSAVRSRGHL